VVPGKFVAFKGPQDLGGGAVYRDAGGYRRFGPGYYLDVFDHLGVTSVVRAAPAPIPAFERKVIKPFTPWHARQPAHALFFRSQQYI
jgi:hypothetical protein